MNMVNLFHKVATKIVRKLLYILGASTVGVRAIVINKNNEVLLVKHTYRQGWYLPGGGVKRGEPAKTAIIRELKEETGTIPNHDLILFGVYFQTYMQANDYVILYIVNDYQTTTSDSPEIAEIKWTHYTDLPADATPATKQRLAEYFNKTAINPYW